MEQQNLLTLLKIIGVLLSLLGLVLSFAPTWVSNAEPALDTFAAIERRIPWGAVLGFGLLLIMHSTLKPWGLTLASLALWVTLGILIARVIGLFLDGMDSQKQWMWVGVEILVIAIAVFFVIKLKESV